MEEVLVVLSAVANEEEGAAMARVLVTERLAACCNLVPAVRSIYRWEGRICDASETLLVIKTVRSNWHALEKRILALHTYDVPEVVALPLTEGSEAYRRWVVENCRP